MRIGELAAATGASVRALRYYEEQGLLESERSASGQRRYGPEAVEQVQWIRQLLAAGLPSRAIVKLRKCDKDGKATAEDVAIMTAERDRIDELVTRLTATRDRLDSMVAASAPDAADGDGPRA
ncbi:MerR family transcriptional regulator [Glycomyces sp. TRM65418]|uniref:MerR family transcriptional regulator n=1 Tax=Glycomyces sp. TRM65418 TaxID=2867006 RepID=UPI001CE6F29A|nr:MerR family transcriptional regulator [Glycomyces sp. TRM65418]MCC3764067.1 MerR family transcriptional regulator [Glycomyces sp. TRM65418]QZD53757.1 MerR family transcriptional regulator [Glycomyces sp. TRM65418]